VQSKRSTSTSENGDCTLNLVLRRLPTSTQSARFIGSENYRFLPPPVFIMNFINCAAEEILST
jgi:hypothetical protein